MTMDRFGSKTSLCLESKIAIVTGASRGIGAATARLLARQGASVVLAARSEDEMARNVLAIEADGGRAVAVKTDVTDAASVEALINQTVDTFGRLDIAVNNAGLGSGNKPLVDFTEQEFDASIAVNLKSVFLSMKYEIPAMVARGGGAIVNLSSTAGLAGAVGIAPYIAGKHGVVGLTKAAALEYAQHHIRVNAVAPGPILTEQMERRIAANAQIEGQINRAVPLGRLGQPAEIAEAILWLCSDAAAYVTGVTLPVDGGRLAA
jgi:NAD(P)-dependent dehydrogenase (short-subunit alcohol dehydrogenase family)